MSLPQGNRPVWRTLSAGWDVISALLGFYVLATGLWAASSYPPPGAIEWLILPLRAAGHASVIAAVIGAIMMVAGVVSVILGYRWVFRGEPRPSR